MANKFTSVMSKIGVDAKVVLGDVVKYVPEAATLAAVIYPPSAAVDASVVTATQLIANAAALVEQKYAASGVAAGTGTQKLGEVLTLTAPAVTALLEKVGINADTPYITSVVNAVVAILNAPNVATAT